MNISYLYGKLIKKLQGTCVTNSKIDKSSSIGKGCNINSITMGKHSYCGHDCMITNCDIGAFCSISDQVYIGGAEHPIDWVSTSPAFQKMPNSFPKKRFIEYDVPSIKRTKVGNDVWIGHGVTIKQGVIIGDGAIIGSNALVTKNVLPYAIMGGVPARIIRFRFEEDIIKKLTENEWWSLPDEAIQRLSQFFKDPNELLLNLTELKNHV